MGWYQRGKNEKKKKGSSKGGQPNIRWGMQKWRKRSIHKTNRDGQKEKKGEEKRRKEKKRSYSLIKLE